MAKKNNFYIYNIICKFKNIFYIDINYLKENNKNKIVKYYIYFFFIFLIKFYFYMFFEKKKKTIWKINN